MANRDPEKNFEILWRTFYNRYPVFQAEECGLAQAVQTYRPQVTRNTSDRRLFEIFCRMLDPLDDGHVELTAEFNGKERYFNPEPKPRFWQEFTPKQIKQLFKTTERTLVAAQELGTSLATRAWMLRYCRSSSCGYIRIR